MSRYIDADALDRAFSKLRFNNDGELNHYGDRPNWYLWGSEVEKLIAEAPSIDIPQWIPCSERLPSDSGEYLVTVGAHDAFVDVLYYGKPLMPNRKVKGKCFYKADDEWGDIVDDDVIAWMPLPKPYGERESE